MKHILTISAALFLLVSFSSCEFLEELNADMEPNLMQVSECAGAESIETRSWVMNQTGRVRRMVYYNQTTSSVETGRSEVTETEKWVIIPDGQNVRFEACNLPASMRQAEMEVQFSGRVLSRSMGEVSTGETPFSLTEIGEAGHAGC